MVLIRVAFLTLLERKILRYIHYRKGPNKVRFWGIFQPFSDAIKLISKEFFLPLKSNYYLFIISPILIFILIISFWLVYPISTNTFNWNLNRLFFLCLISIRVYGLIISGWASNSSFSIIGSIRSISQSISYEVTFSISLILTLYLINSLNLNFFIQIQKYTWLFFIIWPLRIILLLRIFAEINRTPFDLSEGESELVSGFNVEYGRGGFALIFLAEYARILFISILFSLIFLGANVFILNFYIKLRIIRFIFIWIRGTVPRFRYDKLIDLAWKNFLPFSLNYLWIILGLKLILFF